MDRILSTDGSVHYRRIFELLNDCFGTNYTGWMQACWSPKGGSFYAWFPQLAIWKNGKFTSASFGCINTLSEDGRVITFDDIKNYGDDIPEYAKERDHRPCLVFAKEHGGEYIFRGVYLFDDAASTPFHSVYKQISSHVKLLGFPVSDIECL